MSEADPQAVPPSPPSTASDPGKREQAGRILSEILQRMDIAAELDIKDAPDGGISIAIKLQGESAGASVGRRSHVTDALQFFTNKIVNRPGTEKRWISLGIGGHPEPRPKPDRARKQSPPAAPGPKASAPAARNGAPSAAPAEADEASLPVEEDSQLAGAVRELAEKSSRLGHFYAVVAMGTEARARALRAAREVSGVTVSTEGEGRSRRVVFTPAKPAPLPRKATHIYDDEDDRPD